MNRIWQAVVSMGLSSAIVLLLSALRAKIVAVEFGATGIGILGIVSTSVLVAATALGGGLGGSGVRAVAAAPESDGVRRDGIIFALTRGSWTLAVAAGAAVCVSWWIWGTHVVPQLPASMLAPWVGVSVGAVIGTAGNSALLNGVGRIHSLAASNGLGALVGTLIMVLAMQHSARWGLIAAFAASPVATLAISSAMVRSNLSTKSKVPRGIWVPELRAMLVLGLALSSAVILTNGAQLVAKVWVSRQLGIVSAGYLQGCFAVGAVYLGFVLSALAAEYYPRISALRLDIELSNRSVNEQIRVVLALGTPAIVWMIVAAPWLLRLLYSQDFVVAHTLLRLLLVGDVFKLVGWCIGFLLMAREAKTKFFLAELSWNVFFLAILIPASRFGITFAGVAYLVAYVLYAIVAVVLGARESGFVMTRESKWALAWASIAVVATFVTAESGSEAGLMLAVTVALGCTGVAVRKLNGWSRRDSISGR